MQVLNIRFCSVNAEADTMINFFGALGLPTGPDSANVFLAGDSWIELWSEAPDMPEGIMLQIVVDDANAFADHARSNGLDPQGPVQAHGETIYFLQAPSGLNVTLQSVD